MFCIRFECFGYEMLVFSHGGKDFLRICLILLNDL